MLRLSASSCSQGKQEHLPLSNIQSLGQHITVMSFMEDCPEFQTEPPTVKSRCFNPVKYDIPSAVKGIFPTGIPLDSLLDIHQLVQYCQLWKLCASSIQVDASNSWTLFFLLQTTYQEGYSDFTRLIWSRQIILSPVIWAVQSASEISDSLSSYPGVNS